MRKFTSAEWREVWEDRGMASKISKRHEQVQSQLAWMEARGIIHTYSPPSLSCTR